MKIAKILLSLFCTAALFAGCEMTEKVENPSTATDKAAYEIPKEGGSVTIKVLSSVDWDATAAPASSRDNVDDIVVEPASGKASSKPVEVVVTLGPNAGYNRGAIVSFIGDGASAAVTVSQEGELGELIEQITIAEFLAKPVDATIYYLIEGKITSIAQGSLPTDKYSNFYINDGTGEVYVYGLYDGKGGAQWTNNYLYINGITVGYKVKLGATRGVYGSTIEAMNAYIVELTEPSDPMIICDVPEINVAASATEAKFTVKTMNIEGAPTVEPSEIYPWITDVAVTETETEGVYEITLTILPNEGTASRTASYVVSAEGAESVTLTLNQASPMVYLPYSEDFATGQGDFTISNVSELPEPLTAVWAWNTSGFMKGTAYKSGTSYAAESWVVSPLLDLTKAASAKLTFSYAMNYGTAANYAEAFYLMVIDGENQTKVDLANIPASGSWTFIDESVNLSAYAGKKIQVAFVYKSTTENAPTVEFKNVAFDFAPSTIAEVIAAENGKFTVNALVVAVQSTNVVFTDGTGCMFAYSKPNNSAVGDMVRIDGSVTVYNQVKEYNNPTFTVLSQGNEVDHGEAYVIDEAGIAAYATDSYTRYACVEGTVVKSGNYYNLQVGEQKINVYLCTGVDISAQVGNIVKIYGYPIGWKSNMINFVTISFEEVAS